MILFVVYHILEENARVFFCFLQKCGFVVLVRWFEVCKTSKLLLRQEQTFHEMESLKGGLAAERMPPRAAKKAHEVCCPEWGRLSERKVPKGFNFVRGKPPLRRAESRFAEPRCSLQRERIVTFCVVQKVTKKHVLGRAKSCLWQVFVRRRPPKQGELRTDVSKATMFQGDDSVLRPAIQISARFVAFAEVTGLHHVTGHAEHCKVSGYRR